jgi:sRNA-binding carbon storage regulator CsrA
MTIHDLFQGGPVEIVITEINGNQARVGIDAPSGLKVLREELLQGSQ